MMLFCAMVKILCHASLLVLVAAFLQGVCVCVCFDLADHCLYVLVRLLSVTSRRCAISLTCVVQQRICSPSEGICLDAGCFAQDPQALMDTTSTYITPGGTDIPAGSLSSLDFQTATQGSQQSLATYPKPFTAVTCNYPLYSTAKAPSVYNISFGSLNTPEGTKDYAIHSTLLRAYSNNDTGMWVQTMPAINGSKVISKCVDTHFALSLSTQPRHTPPLEAYCHLYARSLLCCNNFGTSSAKLRVSSLVTIDA